MVLPILVACASSDPGTVPDGRVPPDTSDTSSASDTDPSDTDPVGTSDCAERCDDGLDCSLDTCDALDRCIAVPLSTCPWPASLPPSVTGLASSDPSGDLLISLSGATWDADARALWAVRGNGATAWRFRGDGAGGWSIDGKWALGDLDAESVEIVDPLGAPDVLHVMAEVDEIVVAIDVSDPDVAVPVASWDTSPFLPLSGILGSEGLAFVPDAALDAWGFVDELGLPRVSALGHGGLFFVGHQNGGLVHVFDLEKGGPEVVKVGAYATARDDVSGLEFDPGTGRLYVWHGDNANDLEVVRLSSTDAGGPYRVLDSEYLFDYPIDPTASNIEGIALAGLEDCGPGGRPLFLAMDDGAERALDVYVDWPLCRP